jgi:hypothetical protein
MDPSLAIPVRQRSKEILANKEQSLLLNVMQEKLNWISTCSIPSRQLESTTLYLQAVIDIHNGFYERSLRALLKLADGDGELKLVSYAINARDMALLRLGQIYDIKGERQLAIRYYELLAAESQLPPLVGLAHQGVRTSYSKPGTAPGILLREYITRSPLSSYRVY